MTFFLPKFSRCFQHTINNVFNNVRQYLKCCLLLYCKYINKNGNNIDVNQYFSKTISSVISTYVWRVVVVLHRRSLYSWFKEISQSLRFFEMTLSRCLSFLTARIVISNEREISLCSRSLRSLVASLCRDDRYTSLSYRTNQQSPPEGDKVNVRYLKNLYPFINNDSRTLSLGVVIYKIYTFI